MARPAPRMGIPYARRRVIVSGLLSSETSESYWTTYIIEAALTK